MKILQLRFKNLNSLVGEWQIDFTAKEYTSEGIYAITGPTGAGKTTILDAICLALYGKTPRLEAINKKSNEIMSRQTAECYSEVVFATSEGVFLCHWGQHRARKKVEGNLVERTHEISHYPSGEIIESKVSKIDGVVEKKTGLTFNQFTRSILLAQGNFDTFLKADSGARAPILEQITGTEIYSEISIAVFERWRQEKEQLTKIREQIGSVELLSEDAEIQLDEKLASTIEDETALNLRLQQAQKACAWHKDCDKQRENLVQIAAETELLTKEKIDFTPLAEVLKKGQKAATIQPLYTKHIYLQDLQSKDSETLQSVHKTSQEQEKDLKECGILYTQSLKEQQALLVQEEQLRPLIAELRKLDTSISEKNAQAQKTALWLIDAQKKEQEITKSIATNAKISAQLKSDHQSHQNYLEKFGTDRVLIAEFTAIKEKISQLETTVTDGKESRIKLNNLEQKLEVQTQELSATNKEIAKVEAQKASINKAKTQYTEEQAQLLAGRTIEELLKERDFLFKETQYIEKIIRLEDERAHLVSGKECPLCGATEHPFASGEKPKLGVKEKELAEVERCIVQIEKINKDIRSQEEQLHKQELLLQKHNAKAEQLLALRKLTEKELKEHQLQFSTISATYKSLEKSVLDLLPHFDMQTLPEDRSSFVADLALRRQRFIEAEEKCQSFTLQSQKIELEKETLNHAHKEAVREINKINLAIKEEQEVLSATRTKRTELSPADPNQLEEKFAKDKQSISLKVQTIGERQSSLQQEQARILGIIKTTEATINARKEEIVLSEQELTTALHKHNFETKEAFIEACITEERRVDLERQAENIHKNEMTLLSRKTESTKELTRLEEHPASSQSSVEDIEALATLTSQHKELQESLGRIKEQVAVNTRAKEKVAHFHQQILAQEKQFSSWEDLYNMIGSADGKKFRNFAQGLSFELMVNHANRELIKMSDRYLLIRDSDPKNPLELLVVDNYQAGEMRSTKNLSGGESFIISLALALGLSKMASQKVRVDSLFLDEGFGTLDSETLETALGALANLQTEDKLIGIISHIPSLQERIPTQIKVAPQSGGQSSIQGPGCTKL